MYSSILRRLLLLLVVAVSSTAGATFWVQRLLLCWTLIAFTTVHIQYQPYASLSTNRLETFALSVLSVVSAGLASTSISAERLTDSESAVLSLSRPMHLFLVLLVLAAVLVLLYLLIGRALRTGCGALRSKLTALRAANANPDPNSNSNSNSNADPPASVSVDNAAASAAPTPEQLQLHTSTVTSDSTSLSPGLSASAGSAFIALHPLHEPLLPAVSAADRKSF